MSYFNSSIEEGDQEIEVSGVDTEEKLSLRQIMRIKKEITVQSVII